MYMTNDIQNKLASWDYCKYLIINKAINPNETTIFRENNYRYHSDLLTLNEDQLNNCVNSMFFNGINFLSSDPMDDTKIKYFDSRRFIAYIKECNKLDIGLAFPTTYDISEKHQTLLNKFMYTGKASKVLNKIKKTELLLETSDFEKLASIFCKVNYTIKEVSGEDIRKWYNGSTYAENTGTLGSSCMKYECCQSYFNIYCQNENIKMIICLNEENQLCGRSILWLGVDHAELGKIDFMDRIYGVESVQAKIKKYGIDNNYAYKLKQSYSCKDIVFNGVEYDDHYSIIGNFEADEYPYMDSLKVLNEHKSKLGTLGLFSGSVLDSTDGGGDQISCSDCGGSIDSDDCYYDPNGNPLCESCFDNSYVYLDGEVYDRDEVTYCEYCGDYHENDQFEEINGKWICDAEKDRYYVYIEGNSSYTHEDNAITDVYGESYIIDDGEYFIYEVYDDVYPLHKLKEYGKLTVCSSCYDDLKKADEEKKDE